MSPFQVDLSDTPYWRTVEKHGGWHRFACKLLARQVLDDYGIDKGLCLDLGCGLGWFGIELAKLTDLEVLLVDIDRDKLLKARENALKEKVRGRVSLLLVDAHHLPFRDRTMSLIVCRGAVFFWRRPDKAFKEVYRVMKPGAVGFLGGAIGRYMPSGLRARIIEVVKREVRKLGAEKEREWWRRRTPGWLTKWLDKAGVDGFRFIPDPPGIWIEIRKGRCS